MSESHADYLDRNGHALYRAAIAEARAILIKAAKQSLELGHAANHDELHELADLLRVADDDHEYSQAMKVARREGFDVRPVDASHG